MLVTCAFAAPGTFSAEEAAGASSGYSWAESIDEMLSGREYVEGKDYTVTPDPGRKNVGSYGMHVTLQGSYSGTVTKNFRIKRAANSISRITPSSKTLKYSTLKKKALAFQIKAKDKFGASMTYVMDSKTAAKAKKWITISKAGKVTVRKGTPKNTYTVKVKVTAAGTKNYKAKTVTKSMKITVK